MVLEKVQKFLKNKHKFDHKPDLVDVIEKLDNVHSGLKEALHTESAPDLKDAISKYLHELIMIANRYDIDISTLISESFNIN